MGFQLDILAGWITWQKHIPVNTHCCRGHSKHLASENLMSDCWHFEGCVKLPGQLLHILHTWYGGKLLPPVGCIQMMGLPFQPLLIVCYWWLWQKTLPNLVPQLVGGISKKHSNSGLRVGRGPKLPSSTSPPVACPWGPPWGLSSEDVPSSGSQKVTCLLSLWELGDQVCLSWSLPQEWLWLWGHWHLVLSASWLSLSMFSSKMWAASNTHWCASLASWRALSGRLCLPWVWGWGLVWRMGCRIGTVAPDRSSSGPWIPLISIGSSSGRTEYP